MQVRDVVSERHVGHMRIQFWRDTIDAVYKVSPTGSVIPGDVIFSSHKLLSLFLHRAILPCNQ